MSKNTEDFLEAVTVTTADPVVYIAESKTDAVVELWFSDTFHNRAIDPDETNRLTAAKDRLKVLLRGVKE